MRIFLLFILYSIAFAEISEIDTIFGKYKIDDPVVQELLESRPMTRLLKIDQSGIPHYFGHVPAFSRHEHSIGVYALLKHFNAPLSEQVAGLLHDVSHTIFSHLGDFLFHTQDKGESYQDNIHTWFLKKLDAGKILSKYGLSLKNVHPQNPSFSRLDQGLPYLCADRIEYNIHTALILEIIDENEVQSFLKDLHYEKGNWYFTDPKLAKKLGMLSLFFTEYFWGASWNLALNHWYSQILQHAIDSKLITFDDVHFSEDQLILSTISKSKDPKIQLLLKKCRDVYEYYEEVEGDHFDLKIHPKFRGVDPYVLKKGKLMHLSAFDSEFANEFHRVKKVMKKGRKIHFK